MDRRHFKSQVSLFRQQPDWPSFTWQASRLVAPLHACIQAQGRLMGLASVVDADTETRNNLDTLLQNILTSSAIEGETLNTGSVRSSLARRLGLGAEGRITSRSEGLAELMLDATGNHEQPLTLERLCKWHRWLFPPDDFPLQNPIRVGGLRGSEPMQVVSGRLDKPKVHFEAPPRDTLDHELDAFLSWFNSSRADPSLDPLLRAGIAHFWFVTLHPFDDGNGRLTRAITDLALTQGERQTIRFYTMSASILDDRAGYYRILETCQKKQMDITSWLEWFLTALLNSLEQAMGRISRVLSKARFWQEHQTTPLMPEQIKVINRLLDGGPGSFEHGISAAQYQAVAKVSKATATRHLADLLTKGCLKRLPGGGRNTRYQVIFLMGSDDN